jgi:hypothetical protein
VPPAAPYQRRARVQPGGIIIIINHALVG